MNEKVSIVGSKSIIEEGLEIEFIIPKSNFWSIFNSCGSNEDKDDKEEV